RSIKHVGGLPKLALKVPHRRVFAIDSDAARRVVDRDELGLGPVEDWPPTLILIAEPDPDDLARLPRGEVLRTYWRRLFHARVFAEDIDAEALLASTRLPGSADPSAPAAGSLEEPERPDEPDPGPEPPSGPGYRSLLKRADRARERGNLVRAAILRTRAARLA